MTKRTTTITLFDQEQFDVGWPPESLTEHIAWLAEKLESVPAECRHVAKIVIDSMSGYEGEHYGHIVISYERTETDDEEAAREAEEAARRERQRAQELRTLAALQAKYGKV